MTAVPEVKYRIDSWAVKVFGKDVKGKRTRWGDRILHLFSGGKEVAQAVFTAPGQEAPEPYYSQGKIHYFADGEQFSDVLALLDSGKPVYIVWEPVYDPKEPGDGDAYFYVPPVEKE